MWHAACDDRSAEMSTDRRRYSWSGVRRTDGTSPLPASAIVLGGGCDTRSAVDAITRLVEPARTVVVHSGSGDDLGGADLLHEPLDRGTGIALLLALVLRRPSELVVVSCGTGAAACTKAQLLDVRHGLDLALAAVSRTAGQTICVACGDAPVHEGCLVVASHAALVGHYRAAFPCVLRLFEYVASLDGSGRSHHWDFVYRGLKSIDLMREVLAPAERFSVVRAR
jgi:hypothetical protein